MCWVLREQETVCQLGQTRDYLNNSSPVGLICVQSGVSADSKLMKRSFSTIGDQCVNGLWQEQHSLERVSPDDTYRPRQRSYRGQISYIFLAISVNYILISKGLEKSCKL